VVGDNVKDKEKRRNVEDRVNRVTRKKQMCAAKGRKGKRIKKREQKEERN
jgi:hypothetical protein